MSDHNALNKDTVKIIGVDIGFGKVKTANFVFKNAIHKLSSGSALKTNIPAVGDKSYSVGGRRLEVKDSKTLDDNTYPNGEAEHIVGYTEAEVTKYLDLIIFYLTYFLKIITFS